MGYYWTSGLENSLKIKVFDFCSSWKWIQTRQSSKPLHSSPSKSLTFLLCVHLHQGWLLHSTTRCQIHCPRPSVPKGVVALMSCICSRLLYSILLCVFTGRMVIPHVCSQKLPVLAGCTLGDPISCKRKLFVKLLCSAVTKLNLLHTWLSFNVRRIRLLKICWNQMCE